MFSRGVLTSLFETVLINRSLWSWDPTAPVFSALFETSCMNRQINLIDDLWQGPAEEREGRVRCVTHECWGRTYRAPDTQFQTPHSHTEAKLPTNSAHCGEFVRRGSLLEGKKWISLFFFRRCAAPRWVHTTAVMNNVRPTVACLRTILHLKTWLALLVVSRVTPSGELNKRGREGEVWFPLKRSVRPTKARSNVVCR